MTLLLKKSLTVTIFSVFQLSRFIVLLYDHTKIFPIYEHYRFIKFVGNYI